MVLNTGNAGRRGIEREILAIVNERWPTSALEIARHFREDTSSRGKRKKHSTKYAYYLKKLVAKRLVLSKRFGHALVVWPVQAEAYRTIHRILKEAGDA
ncbi:MAG: hypothetical protein HY544_02700 [Candidatus Diapherotrites archaeon]|uniref:Uncharacterized protein n=1 Tax=Candidatus Iainarchaeum sp. TaxID=3101447 RepID=A0A8T3YNI7_9ARCH|nr:hypothetical protein [Candidatus Diapherotrites archaeon]